MVNGFNHLVMSTADMDSAGYIVNNSIIEKITNFINDNSKAIYLEVYYENKSIISAILTRFVTSLEVDNTHYPIVTYTTNFIDLNGNKQKTIALSKDPINDKFILSILDL